MPSRRPPVGDREFDSLRFRRSRAGLKEYVVRISARLRPEMWEELFASELIDGASNPYEWPSYDQWAAAHGVTTVSEHSDWLRILAWSCRRRRALPSRFHWTTASDLDIARSRGRGTLTQSRAHRQDAIAGEAFVRWQILRQDWKAIQAALPEAMSIASVQDLVFRTAQALSFTARTARRGRQKRQIPATSSTS